MTGSNKILTVSYGTFSCTLEGFDDPFGTMRGIAEYFRDLAADDRYFGAEPPTPDVEMLQSIAQKEVSRRVEAHVGESGLALRQVDEADAIEDIPAEPADVEPAASEEVDAETLVSEDPSELPETDLDDEGGPLAFDDDYLMADEPEDVLNVDLDTPTQPSSGAPAESVAEKLRRIRAVVSKSIEPKEPTEPFEDAPDAKSDAGAAEEPRQQRAKTRTIEQLSVDLSDEDEGEEEEFEEEAPLTLSDDATDNADTSLISAIMASSQEADDDADEDDTNLFEDAAEDDQDEDEDFTELEAELAEDDDDFEDVLKAALAQSDDESSEDNESLEEIEDSDADDDVDGDFEEFDLDEDDDFEDDEPESIEVVPAATSRKPSKPLEPLSEENGNVGRLLQETDQKFNEDDGIRRRRVISQMRAAVAATKADRILSRIVPRAEQEAEDQNAYRQDLSRAMTRRPSFSEVARAEAAARPAPLVLVSSQRVDDVKPKKVEAKSEEVKAQEAAEAAGSFREFAASMGARELPDLLEAAAAYSTFVEGQPHFSRPEIMKRAARIDPALKASREAGLRSFGQLLRQGKIHKLQRGQFTVDEATRFNPTQRYAGE